MGMTASQARFLSLTARKSNVEFEGQQINQQRTTLSNQSASYYSELCNMIVPTPPSVEDYTRVTYTFDDGALTNTITAMLAKSDDPGYYSVSYIQQWQDDYAIVPASSSLIEKCAKKGVTSQGNIQAFGSLINSQNSVSTNSTNDNYEYKIGTATLRTLTGFADKEYKTVVTPGSTHTELVDDLTKPIYTYMTNNIVKDLKFNGQTILNDANGYYINEPYEISGETTTINPTISDANKIDPNTEAGRNIISNFEYYKFDSDGNCTEFYNPFSKTVTDVNGNITALSNFNENDWTIIYNDGTSNSTNAIHIITNVNGIYYMDIDQDATGTTASTEPSIGYRRVDLTSAQIAQLCAENDPNSTGKYRTITGYEKKQITTVTEDETKQIATGYTINHDVVDNDPYLKTLTEEQLVELAEQEKYYQKMLNEYTTTGTTDSDAQWYVKYTQNTSTGAWVPSFYNANEVTDGTKYTPDGWSSARINCYSLGSTMKTQEVLNQLARVEKDSSGRYVALTIYPDKNDKTRSITYNLVTNTSTDEDAYNDAMNQYNYDQQMYDKKIQEINSKLEIVQQQDKSLELELKSLDTEENAINTEIDAVKKVIQKNVESSFKTFAA